MKATELMLNDLVTYRGEIYYVADTDRLGGLVGIDNEDDIELIHESEIEPIPLTPEILKKYGFTKTKFDGFYKRFKRLCGYNYVYIDLKNHTVIIGEMYCPPEDYEECEWENEIYLPTDNIYAHQLQHALRLCGLDKLADNFKFE